MECIHYQMPLRSNPWSLRSEAKKGMRACGTFLKYEVIRGDRLSHKLTFETQQEVFAVSSFDGEESIITLLTLLLNLH